jgi:hypothetical protein
MLHCLPELLGYRMAAECARNALLQRTIDNKENTGHLFHYSLYEFVNIFTHSVKFS